MRARAMGGMEAWLVGWPSGSAGSLAQFSSQKQIVKAIPFPAHKQAADGDGVDGEPAPDTGEGKTRRQAAE